MKICVIVNPASGRGRGKQVIPLIEKTLQDSILDFNLLQSEQPLHAIDLAESAARDGYDIILAAGGDGTVNEVLNGLMRAHMDGYHSTALGVISVGTGNDFAESMGLSKDLQQNIQAIKENKRRVIDIGILKGCDFPEGRYFGNCVGIGFDAAGTILAGKLRWVRGTLAYLISAVGTIFFYYKAPTLQIDLDAESITIPSLLVSVMNGKRIGGAFWTAPEAISDDGEFDLCIAEEVSRPRMFTLIPHFLKGTQASQPEIQMKQARSVKISALKGTMPVHIDGEIIGETCNELSIEILPKELEIVGIQHA